MIAAGALADLILVDGDPLADIDQIADPAAKFVVIMNDGAMVKNALPRGRARWVGGRL